MSLGIGLGLGLIPTAARPDPVPPDYTPALDFGDERDSQYVALLFEDF